MGTGTGGVGGVGSPGAPQPAASKSRKSAEQKARPALRGDLSLAVLSGGANVAILRPPFSEVLAMPVSEGVRMNAQVYRM